ncbi:hypothetical protein ACQPW1_10010 [Nocardia sp. CA-128927]|uniref:hypothetical protein n=1 Tax=Nocardia sp. CA-128927 TaxID=3239975 RepID=UPI003D97F69E
MTATVPVVLASPAGVEVTVHSPEQANNLACAGYVRKSVTSTVVPAAVESADADPADRKPKAPATRPAGK